MGRGCMEESSEEGDEIVILEDAVKTYENLIDSASGIRGVNLVLRKGRFLAVMGPEESGKATLLRCLAGQVRLTAGTLWRDPEAADAVLCRGALDERALAGPPRLFLVDGAEPAHCALLRDAVDDGRAVAAVVTTEDVTAAAAADAVLFLHQGRVVDMVAGANPERIRECLSWLGGEQES